MNQMMQE